VRPDKAGKLDQLEAFASFNGGAVQADSIKIELKECLVSALETKI
jgi:hypothetical protein